MRLPDLPTVNLKRRKEMVSTRGINYSDNIQDGDLAKCENLSAKRWPYIATRNKRTQQNRSANTPYTGVTALTSWNKLVAVSGTSLLYDGTSVGTVTAGAKQFAAVNTKLVIWPDKKYLDLNQLTVSSLGATATATQAVIASDLKTITFTGTGDLTAIFKVGDGVTLSGFSTLTGNNRDLVIKELTSSTIAIAAATLVEGTETATIKIERKIPDLDFICESGNRLWGVSNAEKTIYVSALGDPTNFYVYDGLSTDSYALPVASEGNFTGCCKLSSSVLFWKEKCLHKVLGDYPAEYAMYTYEMEGLKSGCEKSMTVINDALFYVGLHGIFTYAGGTPSDISTVFGSHVLTNAVGGTDGEKYYLSCLDNNEPKLYTFNPNEGAWLQEDPIQVVDIASIGEKVYILKQDGTVWLEDSGEDDDDVDWFLEYTPFFETIEGRKRFSRLWIRAELPAGAWLRAKTVTDKGRWLDAGIITGPKEDTVPMIVQPNRGDVYRVKLEGHGPCVIKDVLREFLAGGYG